MEVGDAVRCYTLEGIIIDGIIAEFIPPGDGVLKEIVVLYDPRTTNTYYTTRDRLEETHKIHVFGF